LAQFLQAVGQHELTTADSAHDAIALLDRPDAPHFDCFLLDIQMPGMDGMELSRHIRSQPLYSAAPIIMLTAMSEKRYIDGAFAAGATDYVTKPFDLTELRTRISMAEQLVLGRRPHSGIAFCTSSLLQRSNASDHSDLHAPILLHDIDNVFACTAMENYVAQLSRNALFGSTVFAFALRKPDHYWKSLSGAEFKFLIEDVAEAISDCLSGHQFLMTYAGNGTYVCITESGWRPDIPQLTDAINLHLSRANIMSNCGEELHPRMSAGIAIRLVWKSGDEILNALGRTQTSAEAAAIEYERLKTDFFHVGRSA